MKTENPETKDTATCEVTNLLSLLDPQVSSNPRHADYAFFLQASYDQTSPKVTSQVENEKANIDIVAAAQSRIAGLQSKLDFIDKLCEECQSLEQCLYQIKISHTGNNIDITFTDVEEMMPISAEVAEGKPWLIDDTDLVSSFEKLSILERKMRFVVTAISSGKEEATKVMEYVEDVNNTRKTFEKILWDRFANFVELANDSPDTLVGALMVIEMQEMLEDRKSEEDAELQDTEKITKVLEENSLGIRRGYKERCHKEIGKFVEARFDNLISNLVMEEDLNNALEAANQISFELGDIYRHVRPCPIFQMLVQLYTERFVEMLQKIGDRANNLTSLEILKVTGWAEQYKEQLQNLSVDEAVASICAESESINTLMNAYVGRMQMNIGTWQTSVLQNDHITTPKKTVDGKLWSPAAVHFFRILADEVRVVQENSTGIMLYSIALAVMQAIVDFEGAQRQNLQEPVGEIGLKSLCAIVNNNSRSYDFALDLSNNIMEALNSGYAKQINFEDTCKGFLDIAETGVQKIVNLIFEDPVVKDLVANLYLEQWFGGQVTKDLVDVFGLYIEDIEGYLEPKSFRRFAEAFLEETAVIYVDKFLTQSNVIKEETLERLKLDEDVFREFFKQMIDLAIVEERVQTLAELRDLASAESVESFTKQYATLLQDHPDCPPQIIEKLIALREGIPLQDAREVVRDCKAVYVNSFGNREFRKPGLVFGRLKSIPKASPGKKELQGKPIAGTVPTVLLGASAN